MNSVAVKPPGTRLVKAGAIAFAAVVVSWVVYDVVSGRTGALDPVDLTVYRDGGLIVRHVRPLYDPHAARPLYDWGGYSSLALKFTYTPFAAVAFAVVSFIPMKLLEVLSVLVNIASLLVALWFTVRALGYADRRVRLGVTLAAAAVTFWLQPVVRTIYLGQINLLLMAGIIWDLTQPEFTGDGKRRWWAGAVTGVAAGIKLVPLIFIPYLVLTRRFREAAMTVAGFVATVLVGFAILPNDSSEWWLHGMIFNDGNRTGFTGWAGNQSLRGIITRLSGSISAGTRPYLVAGFVAVVLGILAAVLIDRAGHRMAAVLTTALTGLLASPISWDHHWVWVAPAVVVAWHYTIRAWRAGERWRARWIAAIGAGIIVVFAAWPDAIWENERNLGKFSLGFLWAQKNTSPIKFSQHGDQPQYVEYHWHGFQLLWGNIYILAGMALMLILAGMAVRLRHAAPAPPAAAASELPASVPASLTRTLSGMASMNEAVAGLLREYAELLAMTGGDPFRARNYEKAAKAIAGHPADISTMTQAALTAIPGVGKSTAAKVAEFGRTGTIAALEELRATIPPGARELTRVPGLGPKRALALSRELGIATVDGLEAAVSAGRLRNLAGFGARSEERILRGLSVMTHDRVLLNVAMPVAADIVDTLRDHTDRVAWAGSLRRWRETIGDVDILATAAGGEHAAEIMTAFRNLAGDVVVSGPARTTIRTASGLRAGLRVVRPDCYGAALQYFTGSRAHNVAVRAIAVRTGLTLSEQGLFRGEEPIASATERDVYGALGMEWVPPPMREDAGEVEAALEGQTPRLVQENDIRGDLHTHTNLTDGVASLEDMIRAAETRGYEYYAVTDHAPNLVMQRMTDEKMLAQRERLAGIESRMVLLHGTELNIAPDGSVDWGEDFLAGFDLCVASVHSHFDQDRAAMTRRFITACENPHVNVIGHPLTRKIGRRPPVDVDLPELFRACARTGTALEVNASPARLDLPGDHIRQAAGAGVKFAIDTDAHAIGDLDNLKYGVGTAQRGWLAAGDVINTWPLGKLRDFLRKGRSH